MDKFKKERRKYNRYDMEAKVYFYVDYDLGTKVEYKIINRRDRGAAAKKGIGLSKNFNVRGMRFSSDKKLAKGDALLIHICLPKHHKPIAMEGKVRWSREIIPAPAVRYKFDTGVKLVAVEDKPVTKTIHFDKEYGVPWSIVLESVFGGFKDIARGKSS